MKGSRCKFTEAHVQNNRVKNPDRLGTIVGESGDKSCWRVQWDGMAKNSATSHPKSSLQITSSAGASTSLSQAKDNPTARVVMKGVVELTWLGKTSRYSYGGTPQPILIKFSDVSYWKSRGKERDGTKITMSNGLHLIVAQDLQEVTELFSKCQEEKRESAY